jgi:hypothetical protein
MAEFFLTEEELMVNDNMLFNNYVYKTLLDDFIITYSSLKALSGTRYNAVFAIASPSVCRSVLGDVESVIKVIKVCSDLEEAEKFYRKFITENFGKEFVHNGK